MRTSISLPDDVGTFLAAQPNASAVVAESLRAVMNDQERRHQRRRQAARAYSDWALARCEDTAAQEALTTSTTGHMPVARGQLWQYAETTGLGQVLIISTTEFQDLPAVPLWGLRVDRRTVHATDDLTVVLSLDDPLPGATVLIPSVLSCDTPKLHRSLGAITAESMEAVDLALRAYLT